MKQFAAMMMFAAWLLYGAMPAMATMPINGKSMDAGTVMADHVMPGHSGHGDVAVKKVHSGQPDNIQQPCPHEGESGKTTCVAPFCSACLVIPPHIVFTETGRFVHPHRAPDAGPSIIVSGPAPLTPPPRA
ncbi:hypothetical protein [Aliirhizobium smilacinae]|uniref:DUF2946 domain-containing protein n=1 Tax=Aliirhizobium smilacinae TaxID=1395944 RepID=A0A5C4XTI4_9HYPH|nr:hypothetical protein [Rhizobium smilacinae]TNM65994.1 hypothetical protein FHP24_07160 [Rhizobium smilacinae]